jgi:hypothetical protein
MLLCGFQKFHFELLKYMYMYVYVYVMHLWRNVVLISEFIQLNSRFCKLWRSASYN